MAFHPCKPAFGSMMNRLRLPPPNRARFIGGLRSDGKGIGWPNIALLVIDAIGGYRCRMFKAGRRASRRRPEMTGLNGPWSEMIWQADFSTNGPSAIR